nr:DNA methyltransferase [Bradyrhizobium sp. WSM2793]
MVVRVRNVGRDAFANIVRRCACQPRSELRDICPSNIGANLARDHCAQAIPREAQPNFPLTDGGHIFSGNALQLDWLNVCPVPVKSVQKEKVFDLATVVKVHAKEDIVDDEVETYVIGNPPYLGGKIQNAGQKEDLRKSFSRMVHKPEESRLRFGLVRESDELHHGVAEGRICFRLHELPEPGHTRFKALARDIRSEG